MYVLYWWKTETTRVPRLPAALAYKLIRRGYSPTNLANARYAMAARWARPAADGGRLAQLTKASGPGDQARPRGLKPRAAAGRDDSKGKRGHKPVSTVWVVVFTPSKHGSSGERTR